MLKIFEYFSNLKNFYENYLLAFYLWIFNIICFFFTIWLFFKNFGFEIFTDMHIFYVFLFVCVFFSLSAFLIFWNLKLYLFIAGCLLLILFYTILYFNFGYITLYINVRFKKAIFMLCF